MLLELFLIVVFALLIPTSLTAYIGAPLALTKKKELLKILQKAGLKQGQRFYDLGCGTGRVLIQTSKKYGTRPIGFEMSPIWFLFAWLNLKINRVKGRVFLKDLFGADLSEADIVFCFLMPKALKKLTPKLKKELKPKTKIISYCFPLPGMKPRLALKDKTRLPVYFYDI